MIWIIYLGLGIYTLYHFYKSKEFWELSFLLLLATSYFGGTMAYQNLPFFARLLLLVLAFAVTVFILFHLNKKYRIKKLEARREERQKNRFE